MLIGPKMIDILKHQVASVRKQKTDQGYLAGVIKIMNLIEKIAPELHQKWRKKSDGCKKKCSEFEVDAVQKFKQAFESLNIFLVNEGLANDPIIQECAQALESIFNDKPGFIIPAPSWQAYDNFSKICHRLLYLGRDDLVVPYAKVKYIEGYKYQEKNPKTGLKQYYCGNCCEFSYNAKTSYKDMQGRRVLFEDLPATWTCPICDHSKESFVAHMYKVWVRECVLKRFIIAQRFFNLLRIQSLFDPARVDSPAWVAYEYLYRVKWSSGEPSRDYFRKKKLCHQQKIGAKPKNGMNSAACARDANLLGLHFTYVEIKSMQKRSPLKRRDGQFFKSLIYSRMLIDHNLNIVLIHIYKNASEAAEFKPVPSTIELIFEDDKYLRLKVEWCPGLIEILILHTFKNDNDDANDYAFTFTFINELIEKGFSQLDPKKGLNANKYLQQAGINGILDKLFVMHKTSLTAKLDSKICNLNEMSAQDLKALCKVLSNLEHVRWN